MGSPSVASLAKEVGNHSVNDNAKFKSASSGVWHQVAALALTAQTSEKTCLGGEWPGNA